MKEHELTTEKHIVKRKMLQTTYHFKYTSDQIVLTEAEEEQKFVRIKYTPDDKEDGKDVLYLTPSCLKIIKAIIEEHPEVLKDV